MGTYQNFWPRPLTQNPKGFYENYDFRKINDELLNKAGYDVKTYEPQIPFSELTDRMYTKMKKLVCRYHDQYPDWGWKDPRNIFTINLWLEIFPELKILIVRRNGIDVANSLYQRQLKQNQNNSSGPFYIKPLRRRIRESVTPIENYNFQSCRCTTLKGCFGLWEEYQYEADEIFQHFEGDKLYISYEDLLLRTTETTGSLELFLNREISMDEKQFIHNEINPRRCIL